MIESNVSVEELLCPICFVTPHFFTLPWPLVDGRHHCKLSYFDQDRGVPGVGGVNPSGILFVKFSFETTHWWDLWGFMWVVCCMCVSSRDFFKMYLKIPLVVT